MVHRQEVPSSEDKYKLEYLAQSFQIVSSC
jgi:hypothetical protein